MKRGFTLAEILITLGIVGIVAVLTLPNMIKNHQKRVMVTQLQRTYNAITNAIPMYLDETHATNLFETDAFNYHRSPEDVTPLVNFFKDNFKTSKICTNDTTGGRQACFGEKYTDFYGDDRYLGGHVCAILKTGATVCVDRIGSKDEYIYLYMDVNGPQGPNVYGRDTFGIEMNASGDIAESFDENVNNISHGHNAAQCETELNPYGRGCFNKIIEDGWKMDY